MRLHPAISVINESTVLTDDAVYAAIPAFQHQVTYHFGPIWNCGAHFYTKELAPLGAWQLVILDDSDQAGALGYHWLTDIGMPIMRVFVRTDQQYGLSWTVTASHEYMEALADPYCSAAWQPGTSNNFYACEVGDPVEADEYGYMVGGVLLSDFITPAWFDEGPPVLTRHRYDYAEHLNDPLEVLPGGYVSIFDITQSKWTQFQQQHGELVAVELEGSMRFRDRSARKASWDS